MPSAGTLADAMHRLPIRVYFEDTDASGIVYHANYLRFMERARSDMIRLLGFDQQPMLARPVEERVFFTVRSIAIDYLRPARLDDCLTVESEVVSIGAAQGVIGQRVVRADALLAEASVRIAFLGGDGRPRRMPASLRQAFAHAFPSLSTHPESESAVAR